MKWFKHMTTASEDEFIAHLEKALGLEAVARWWKMLEAIGKQMDGNRSWAEYPVEKWMVFLSEKREKNLRKFLEFCQNCEKISLESNGILLRIDCPKLLELRDEYSRKSGQPTQKTPDKVAPDTEVRVKKEVETPTAPLLNASPAEKKKGSRFALTELPDDWRKFCVEHRPDLDPEAVFVEFADYWRAVPGQRGLKLDWDATWRNRVRDKKPQQGAMFYGKTEKSKLQLAAESIRRGSAPHR